MKWAVDKLIKGETVQFRPRGNSMKGLIESGELVTVEPIKRTLEIGDIVLCRVKGRYYLHLVKGRDVGRYLIGNNKGYINGWTSSVYGILKHVS